jgi:hypothetical protein
VPVQCGDPAWVEDGQVGHQHEHGDGEHDRGRPGQATREANPKARRRTPYRTGSLDWPKPERPGERAERKSILVDHLSDRVADEQRAAERLDAHPATWNR